MKILFTTNGSNWDSLIDARFGRTTGFLLLEENDNSLKYFDNSINQQAAHGAGLQTVKTVLEIKPDIVITGNGPGEKANALIKDSDIKIYTGAGDMTVKDAYEIFKQNKLPLF